MKIRGIVLSELEAALARANAVYDGNLRLLGATSYRGGMQFRLGVYNSHAYGARLASSGKRHTPSASWEAHRDLFREVYKINPDAVIVTMLARYDGSADFEKKFPATANHQMGSRMEPTNIRELSIHRSAY